MPPIPRTLFLGAWIALAACSAGRPPATLPAGAEALSLFGEPLVPPPLSPEVQAEREAELEAARAALAQSPGDAGALIWVGRRIAYLGRYREAIEVFARGVAEHPDDPRFLRHRGHRFLTLRRFDRAVEDLEKAARLIEGKPDEVEPDGLPNARGIPTSTLHSNIWYHLGLAHFLQGDFGRALAAYRQDLAVAANPDTEVSARYWLWLILRRLDREEEARQVAAPVREDLDIIENQAYHRLLLLFQGGRDPAELLAGAEDGRDTPAAGSADLDPATIGYGVAAWHLVNGRRDEAVQGFKQVVARGPWNAFGAIAAEAELRRLGEAPSPP